MTFLCWRKHFIYVNYIYILLCIHTHLCVCVCVCMLTRTCMLVSVRSCMYALNVNSLMYSCMLCNARTFSWLLCFHLVCLGYSRFALMCKNEKLRDNFEDQFPVWSKSVTVYCRETQANTSAVKSIVSDFSDDMNDGQFMKYTLLLGLI